MLSMGEIGRWSGRGRRVMRPGLIGKWIGWLILALGIIALLVVMARSGRVRPDGPMQVVVSIPPLAWAVEGMLPEDAEVRVLLEPGTSAHAFELTASQVRSIISADLVLVVGMGLDAGVEQVLDRHGADWRRVVRFEDVAREAAETDEAITLRDPHYWLDPMLYADFVKRVGAVMDDDGWLLGGPDEVRRVALAQKLAEVERIHEEYQAGLSSIDRREIVTHHAAWGHLARRYGLEVDAVIRPSEFIEPTAQELAGSIEAVRALDVPTIFVEPQFHDAASRRIAEATGASVLVIDPLGDGDWPGMMRSNLKAFLAGLGGADVESGEGS